VRLCENSLCLSLCKLYSTGLLALLNEFFNRAPDVDHDVRWHLLKLGDLLLRGADEAPPKVIVRLPPPTPVQEFAQTPFIRQPIKREKVKADGSMRSPLTPLGTGGLKLTIGPSSSVPTPLLKGPKTPSVPRTPSIVIGPPKPVGRPVEKKLDKPIKRAREPEAKPVMERAQRVACKNILTAVSQSKHSQIFLQPVDPVRDKAPK
jgi:transcription initiation factor TFIID subunit 2